MRNHAMSRWLPALLAACLMAGQPLGALAAPGGGNSGSGSSIEIDGMSFDEVITVDNTKLVLNGAGWRKRGYFKVDVTGLYLAQKAHTLAEVETLPGPKRIQLAMLQEISGSTASRYFLADFEAVATKDEFRVLFNEVFQIGQIYASLPKLKKGDYVSMDIIPGKGLMASLNGVPMLVPGTDTRFIKNDLIGRIFLRMYVGGRTPAELQNNLLGTSKSMR